MTPTNDEFGWLKKKAREAWELFLGLCVFYGTLAGPMDTARLLGLSAEGAAFRDWCFALHPLGGIGFIVLYLIAGFAETVLVFSIPYAFWEYRNQIRQGFRRVFQHRKPKGRFRVFVFFRKRRKNTKAPPAPKAPNALETAFALFGLVPGTGKTEFDLRYRELMRRIHPDAAGPNDLARQLNQARDVIYAAYNWT